MTIPAGVSSSWSAVLTPELRDRSITVARDVGNRLRDRDFADRAAALASQQTAYPRSTHWHPAAVAQGYAGLAIMCSYFEACFPGEGWDATGHDYLLAAVEKETAIKAISPGLFDGLSGVAFAAWCLSRSGTRYQRLLTSLDELICEPVVRAASALETKPRIAVHEFDLISGLSGIAGYLLCRRSDPSVERALTAVVRSLSDMCLGGSEVPRWFTPPEFLDEDSRSHYPNGNLNCGLAHGIPGPLAVLALARRSGVMVPGIDDAIQRAADWLVLNRTDDSWGPNWPHAIPSTTTARAGWCYGSPGIARSLWLAAIALGASAYAELAASAITAACRRPRAERRVDSPTFCHGASGLLQITLRFAVDTGDPILIAGAGELCEQILSAYDPNSLIGYTQIAQVIPN